MTTTLRPLTRGQKVALVALLVVGTALILAGIGMGITGVAMLVSGNLYGIAQLVYTLFVWAEAAILIWQSHMIQRVRKTRAEAARSKARGGLSHLELMREDALAKRW